MLGIGEIIVGALLVGAGRLWGAFANSKKSNNVVKY